MKCKGVKTLKTNILLPYFMWFEKIIWVSVSTISQCVRHVKPGQAPLVTL